MAEISCLTSTTTTTTTATVVSEAPSQSSPAIVNSHVCSDCSVAFQTHQALGGHKTCHRRKPPAAASSERVHKCATCGRTFKTGQALGGHMRKHYTGVIKRNNDEKSTVKSSSGGGSTRPPALDLTLKL